MRPLALLASLFTMIVLALPSPGRSETFAWPRHPSHMTLAQRASYHARVAKHAADVLAFLTTHRRLAASGAGVRVRRYFSAQLHWSHQMFVAETAKLRPPIPHLSAWLCIHRYEGSWTDPNPPYYGGLQLDAGFQATYGPDFEQRWGTADHWPVWAQMTAAERAYSGYAGHAGRGFTPWPSTARVCGLL